MGDGMNRPELNVSGLPTVVFGRRSPTWWGIMGLMLIEGTMFAMVLASYYYYRTRTSDWPPGLMPPALIYGIINTTVFVASLAPNYWINKAAPKGDLLKVRLGLLIMTAIGIVNMVLRVFEFKALNCQWDANAYASIVWTILGLHTVHLVTDWFDTVVLLVLMFRNDLVEGKRFVDVEENAYYWYFVVIAWLPIWFTLYIAPRLF
jgi:cytochrome c oxidase subunit III